MKEERVAPSSNVSKYQRIVESNREPMEDCALERMVNDCDDKYNDDDNCGGGGPVNDCDVTRDDDQQVEQCYISSIVTPSVEKNRVDRCKDVSLLVDVSGSFGQNELCKILNSQVTLSFQGIPQI